MGIFNLPAESPWATNTVNREGAPAFDPTDQRYKLASLVLTSFVKDQFYRSSAGTLFELRALVGKVDPLFTAKLALFARNDYGMRSISHVLAGELISVLRGTRVPWAREFYRKVARRPDDMLEILGYYKARTGITGPGARIRRIPNYVKGGFAKRLAEFDAYQLGKYRAEGKDITLVDLVNLCHPKANDALNQLMKGQLTATNTFESTISASGQREAEVDVDARAGLRSEAWGSLITTRKLGYMALLKNLRNIATQAPEHLGAALGMLQDEHLIRKSLVLPFRYYTALAELQKAQVPQLRLITTALEMACEKALANVPTFEGRTLIALDKSGSMAGKQIEIGAQFAAVLYKANDADLIIFDTEANYLPLSAGSPALAIQQTILMNCRHMGGTSFPSVFDTAIAARRKWNSGNYDRVIFITDDQGWIGVASEAYRGYCRETASRPSIFLIDTAGYGSLSFPQDKVFAVAGFSDKIFELMKILESDRAGLVNRIEALSI